MASVVDPPVLPGPVDTFRDQYRRLEQAVASSVGDEFGDSTVLQRLGDNLDVFARRFNQATTLFLLIYSSSPLS